MEKSILCTAMHITTVSKIDLEQLFSLILWHFFQNPNFRPIGLVTSKTLESSVTSKTGKKMLAMQILQKIKLSTKL